MRIVAAMVLSTMPTDSISWLRKDWWVSLNSPKEASSITALTSSSNSAGRMMTFAGVASPRPELIRRKSGGTLSRTIARLSAALWPTRPSRSASRELSWALFSAP